MPAKRSRRLNVELPPGMLEKIAKIRKKLDISQPKLIAELLTIGLKGLGK
jgi:DNA-binding transcriptional regulator YiaG